MELLSNTVTFKNFAGFNNLVDLHLQYDEASYSPDMCRGGAGVGQGEGVPGRPDMQRNLL